MARTARYYRKFFKAHKIGFGQFLEYDGPPPASPEDALEIAIAKWVSIVEVLEDMLLKREKDAMIIHDGGRLTCGLCYSYFDFTGCDDRCPVKITTGVDFCKGNKPYMDYGTEYSGEAEYENNKEHQNIRKALRHARAEARLLKSMRKLYIDKWHIVIESINGTQRAIQLDHRYTSRSEAEREAEDIADQEYTESDVAWALVKGEAP